MRVIVPSAENSYFLGGGGVGGGRLFEGGRLLQILSLTKGG